MDRFDFVAVQRKHKGEKRWRLGLSNILRSRYLKIGSNETKQGKIKTRQIDGSDYQCIINNQSYVSKYPYPGDEVLHSGKELGSGTWFLSHHLLAM